MTTPANRFAIKELARTTVDGTEYVIYSDGEYTTAIESAEYDADTDEADYSLWCAQTVGVGDEALLARVLHAAAEDGASLRGAVTAGSCVWVDTPA